MYNYICHIKALNWKYSQNHKYETLVHTQHTILHWVQSQTIYQKLSKFLPLNLYISKRTEWFILYTVILKSTWKAYHFAVELDYM